MVQRSLGKYQIMENFKCFRLPNWTVFVNNRGKNSNVITRVKGASVMQYNLHVNNTSANRKE